MRSKFNVTIPVESADLDKAVVQLLTSAIREVLDEKLPEIIIPIVESEARSRARNFIESGKWSTTEMNGKIKDAVARVIVDNGFEDKVEKSVKEYTKEWLRKAELEKAQIRVDTRGEIKEMIRPLVRECMREMFGK